MWPIAPQKNKIATFSITPRSIHCFIIEQFKNRLPLKLIASHAVSLANHDIKADTLFNITGIGNCINDFLITHQIPDAQVCISLSSPFMRNAIVINTDSDAQSYTDLNGENQSMWIWHQHFLYPNDAGGFTFYACGMPQTLRLQWQLLAASIALNLTTLTSNQMSLLCLYKALYGTAFRQSQLALHMAQTDNNLSLLFSIDTLGRILHIPHTILINRQQELPFLLNACGLFLSERNI